MITSPKKLKKPFSGLPTFLEKQSQLFIIAKNKQTKQKQPPPPSLQKNMGEKHSKNIKYYFDTNQKHPSIHPSISFFHLIFFLLILSFYLIFSTHLQITHLLFISLLYNACFFLYYIYYIYNACFFSHFILNIFSFSLFCSLFLYSSSTSDIHSIYENT